MLLNLFYLHHHQPIPTRSSFKIVLAIVENIFKNDLQQFFVGIGVVMMC